MLSIKTLQSTTKIFILSTMMSDKLTNSKILSKEKKDI